MAYQMMLMDVSPGGQYALYQDPLTNQIVPNLYLLSVLNTGNLLVGANSHWRNPIIHGTASSYFKEDGTTIVQIIRTGPDPAFE